MTKTRIKVSRKDFKRLDLPDYDPDLSHLGEYSRQPGPDDRTIDRESEGDMLHGEFRYFIAAMSGDDTGNTDSVRQDYKRMEDYNRGYWAMIGIRASVTILIPHGNSKIMQKIESPGLWGIESDSDGEYLQSVFIEECSVLADMVEALGGIELVD